MFLTVIFQLVGVIPTLAQQSLKQVPNPPGPSDALISGRD